MWLWLSWDCCVKGELLWWEGEREGERELAVLCWLGGGDPHLDVSSAPFHVPLLFLPPRSLFRIDCLCRVEKLQNLAAEAALARELSWLVTELSCHARAPLSATRS